MKRLIFLTVFLSGFFCANIHAQTRLMKDASGTILGYEDEKGNLYNNSSVQVLNMKDNLTIVVPTGDTLAVYNEKTKELRYTNGDLVFKMNKENQVLNSANQVVGWIDKENNLYGVDALLKLKAPGIAPFKLAYYYFFSNR